MGWLRDRLPTTLRRTPGRCDRPFHDAHLGMPKMLHFGCGRTGVNQCTSCCTGTWTSPDTLSRLLSEEGAKGMLQHCTGTAPE